MSSPKVGKVYKFRRLLFWAQSGMICIEDTKDGEFKIAMVRDFLKRAEAINGALYTFKYADEREEHCNFVEHAVQACQEAKSQGRPDDPKAVMEMLRQRRRQSFLMGTASACSNVMAAGDAPEGLLLPAVPCAPAHKKPIII